MSLTDAPLLVSLPAREIAEIEIPSSVFGREVLEGAALSPRLAAAIDLIQRSRRPDAPLWFVARPEIFTDGASLQWLTARVGGAMDHLGFSDGASIKLLPGFRNHVFFYGLGWRRDGEALARLERRTPELFAQIESQVNTALAFRWKGDEIAPPTVTLLRRDAAPAPPFELRRLFLNRNTCSDSAARMMASAPLDVGALRFAKLNYMRLSERALKDKLLTQALAGELAAHYVDPSRATLFVAPRTHGAAPDLRERLDTLATGLIEGGCRTPLTPASNLLVATEDLSEEALAFISDARRLFVDDADDFWRLPKSFASSFADTTVLAQRRRHRSEAFEALLTEAYGPAVRIAWTSRHGAEAPC